MIYLKLPGLPPSTNHVYTTIIKPGKGGFGKKNIPMRVMTKEGKKYKEETTSYLSKAFPAELARFKPNKPYIVMFRLSITGLHTKGWPKTAQSRYKKLDATNRTKVLEDVLADISAVDDSSNMVFIVQKVDSHEELTEIWAWNMEEEGSPFTDALVNL